MKPVHTVIPPHRIHFWTNYLIQMRPYLFFVSGMAGLAGMAVFPGLKLFSVYPFLLFLAFFFSYGFGQALTDCYQTDTDRLSAPYRPLSRGILSIQHVKYTSIVGLLSVAFIIVIHNFDNLFLCALQIFGLWSYSYFKRNYWFAGPLYNAWIVSLLAIIGYLSSAGLSIRHVIDKNILIVTLLIFSSYTNFVLIGYLKDITADKKTGYKTFPVVFGWNSTIWVGDLVLLLGSAIYALSFMDNIQGLLFGIAAMVFGISGQLYAHVTKHKHEKNAGFPILATVRSFLLWNAGITSFFHKELIVFCLVVYFSFEVTAYLRPMKEQI